MGELGGAGDDDESFGEPADERVEGGLVVEEPSEVHATGERDGETEDSEAEENRAHSLTVLTGSQS
jgi:hypothetical protein